MIPRVLEITVFTPKIMVLGRLFEYTNFRKLWSLGTDVIGQTVSSG